MKIFWVIRALVLRLFYKNLKLLYLGKPIYIKNLRQLKTSKGVGIYPLSRIEILNDSIIQIGENTRIGHCLFIDASASVTIGKNCTFSSNVFIATADYNWNELGIAGFKNSEIEPKSVIIGNNVFIGINTVVFPGTIIEDNAVIGANSIVKGIITKNTIFYNEFKSISK